MTWLAFLTAAIKAAFEAFGDAWNKRQQTLDEQALGVKTQALADAFAAQTATKAELTAAVDAPKTVEGVEGELDRGTF